MNSSRTVLLSATLLIIVTKILGQNPVTLELLQTLQDKIDILNITNRNYQIQINRAYDALAAAVDQEFNDYAAANNRISTINANVNGLSITVNGLSSRLTAVEGNVASLEAQMASVLGRITKMETINQVWRANFKVVNSTFAQLRKKFKFIIPYLGLPVLPAVG